MDFEDEFEPILKISEEEAKEDKLVKQIRLQRKLLDAERRNKKAPTDEEKVEDETKKITIDDAENDRKRSGNQIMMNLKKIKLINSLSDGQENVGAAGSTKTPPAAPSSKQGVDPSKNSKKPSLAKALKFLQKFNQSTPVEKPEKPFSSLSAAPPVSLSYSIENYPEYAPILENVPNFNPNIEDVVKIKKTVLDQLIGKNDNFPNLLQSSLVEKYDEVYRMFEHTIKDNEGHSALLIGPRASGKTAIVQRALRELEKKYSNEFIVVKLNAYHQTDENTALREIARQLDKNLRRVREESEPNNNGKKRNSDIEYANFEQRSLSDTFANILSILDKNEKKHNEEETRTVSIIFVIEEFEKFTLSSRQTLLYNLFDLSQSSSTPVCIIGISSKVTARELLEKRVRSRFSQRIISINKARSIEEFWSNAKLGLIVDVDVINGLRNPSYGELWNRYIEYSFNSLKQGTSMLRKLVITNYYTSKNYKEFNNSVIPAIAAITSISHPFPMQENFSVYTSIQSINNIQSIVKSLSELELLIIIAAARWIEKSSLQVINFNLAYREYEEMMKQYNISATSVASSTNSADNQIITNFKINQRIWSVNILKNCWENLYKLELLLEPNIEKATAGYNAGVIEESHMVHIDVTLGELGDIVDEFHFAKKLTRL
ncbi:putative origin recognition complex subunit 4 [[Candida] railenensis]|uniref:Origin recognition complex subunit 4 n=1 Tax=[Candida] railenensis TaxID=45579 RepID=A0A9P0QRG7_9ASCO|nr:putative origin recognition complex subunit 4 [[Candida] railenensis]